MKNFILAVENAADAERKRRFMLNSWKEKLHAI